ncbi:WhiB family transcriptional regulator [Streptomyces lydicus]|uniref:WhiB family transcriptional regulator n=1 Tax=Streptomyces lydicus TaxID=47763 RepID=UPI00378D81EA
MTTHAPHTPPHNTGRATPQVTSKNWRDHIACTADDWDALMADDHATQETAKRICAPCPAKEFCLKFALDIGATSGVFGEKTARERQSLVERPEETRTADLIDAIVALRREGVIWSDIGHELGIPAGALRHRVLRWARGEMEAGRSVPDELSAQRRCGLSEREVVEIRERAEAGETSAEASLRTGLSKTSIKRIVSGERYPEFGGPLRVTRRSFATRPTLASRTLFNGERASSYGVAS